MNTKAELRRRMLAARDALSPQEVQERSARIQKHLLAMPEVAGARSIFTYVSDGGEVDTRSLILELLAAGKTVLVPLITGEGVMEPHRIRALDDLCPGKFGILAPTAPDPFGGTPDVTLCPGVAFSPQGDRLGRGKAYYDRFLAAHPDTLAIALGYDFQVVAEVPVGADDRKVQRVVCETGPLELQAPGRGDVHHGKRESSR